MKLPEAVAAYYRRLDGGDFAGAAASFTTDVVYAKPPLGGRRDAPRVVVRGRDLLLQSFEQRGRQPFRHQIVSWAHHGPELMLEGMVSGLPGGDGTSRFLASITLADDGAIRRYVIGMTLLEREPVGVTRGDAAGTVVAHAVNRLGSPSGRVSFVACGSSWIGVEAQAATGGHPLTILDAAEVDGMVARCSWVSFPTPAVDGRASG